MNKELNTEANVIVKNQRKKEEKQEYQDRNSHTSRLIV